MKKKILILITCLVMVALSCVPCFASSYEEYSYNGYVLPKLPNEDGFYVIYTRDTDYVLCTNDGRFGFTDINNSTAMTLGDRRVFLLENGAWVEQNEDIPNCKVVWSNYNITDSAGQTFSASDVVVRVVQLAVEYSDFKSAIEAFAKQITVQQVVSVLAWIASAVVAFPFLWWGVRKLTRALMGAFKKGRISL